MMIKTIVMERQGILRGTSLTTILEAILSRSLIGPYSFPTEVNLGRLVFWVGVAKKFLHLSLSDWPLADGPIEREPCIALWKTKHCFLDHPSLCNLTSTASHQCEGVYLTNLHGCLQCWHKPSLIALIWRRLENHRASLAQRELIIRGDIAEFLLRLAVAPRLLLSPQAPNHTPTLVFSLWLTSFIGTTSALMYGW